MKLFFNERKHTLIRWNSKDSNKKVAPFTEFEADAAEAASLMKKYPGKILEVGSAEHKKIMDKLKRGVIRPTPGVRTAATTKDVKNAVTV